MNREDKRALAGLGAAAIGTVQVSSLIVRIASPIDSLTVIHTLQSPICGSLLITGILTR